MSDSSPPSGPPTGGGDPWTAFGYLVAGVGVYGALGWGLATWLHASYLIPIGIVVGAVLGLVMVVYQTGLFSGASGTPTAPAAPRRSEPDRRDEHHGTIGIDHHNAIDETTQGSAKDLPPGQSTDDRGDSE